MNANRNGIGERPPAASPLIISSVIPVAAIHGLAKIRYQTAPSANAATAARKTAQ